MMIFNGNTSFPITTELANKLVREQFPEYANLPVIPVEKQGHDHRTYRLGTDLLIRMPIAESYAIKLPQEGKILAKLKSYLSVEIPVPIKLGSSSMDYPYNFAIYRWLDGKSLNLVDLADNQKMALAHDLAKFLNELRNITDVKGPEPGQHNFWRGDNLSVYDRGAREQIEHLRDVIDYESALAVWEKACETRWETDPVWIHGDIAVGNIVIRDGKLYGIIDFGLSAVGDPACDLTIAWTFFTGEARKVFIREIGLDKETWLRAKGWTVWKATNELCKMQDKNSLDAIKQKNILLDVCSGLY